jgi:hypothetical protein
MSSAVACTGQLASWSQVNSSPSTGATAGYPRATIARARSQSNVPRGSSVRTSSLPLELWRAESSGLRVHQAVPGMLEYATTDGRLQLPFLSSPGSELFGHVPVACSLRSRAVCI